jgi:integrase
VRVRRNGGATLAEARAAATELLGDDAATKRVAGPTVASVCQKYLASRRGAPKHSLNTLRRMMDAAADHFGDTPLRLLTALGVQHFISEGATHAERHKRHRYLRAAVRAATNGRPPCPWPAAPKGKPKRRRALAPEEVRRLFAVAEDAQLDVLLRLVVGTGLRHREATSRTWQCFDEARSTLVVEDEPRADFSPKTDESIREVELPEPLVRRLLMWREEWRTLYGREPEPTDWLLPDTVDPMRAWDQGRTCRTVRACFDRAGLAKLHGVGLHCLRRTWATQALEQGASLDVVQDAGGWASEQVLLRHYARPLATARRRLAAGVGAALLED